MNMRSFLLLASGWVVALLVTLWFGVFHRSSQPPVVEGQSSSKTTPELLIGKWKLVKSNSGLPKGLKVTTEFTKDGKVTIWIDNPLEENGPDVQTGVYRLEGKTLWLLMDPNVPKPHIRASAIELINEDKLVKVGWHSVVDQQTAEFERVRNEAE